jgi:hypothetical protein
MADRLVWAVVNARIWQESDKAIKLTTGQWIPKSLIKCFEYEESGDSKKVILGERVRSIQMPEWLAEEKNYAYE